MHKSAGRTEWSGELITREEGVITDLDSWTIICEDIFLADIGTPGGTEYEVDKGGFKAVDIIEMYDAFPDLLEGKLKNHHIHTHHGMGAFFSGTDWKQLEARAKDSNYFLMLVVDFTNTYKAKVAFKSTLSSGKGQILSLVNNLDGYKPIKLTGDKRKEVLVVMDCKIEYETEELNRTDPFIARYEHVKREVEKEKESQKKPQYVPMVRQTAIWDDDDEIDVDLREPVKTRKKNIMSMTDKEWEKENCFTKRDAYALINGAMDGGIDKNYTKNAIVQLFTKDKQLKTTREKEEWVKRCVTSMENWFYSVYNQEVYEDLLEVVIEELDNFKFNPLVGMLHDALYEEQLEQDCQTQTNSIYE